MEDGPGCCVNNYGRWKCPRDQPFMCAGKCIIAEGETDYCCFGREDECPADEGGTYSGALLKQCPEPLSCPSSGIPSFMMCRDKGLCFPAHLADDCCQDEFAHTGYGNAPNFPVSLYEERRRLRREESLFQNASINPEERFVESPRPVGGHGRRAQAYSNKRE